METLYTVAAFVHRAAVVHRSGSGGPNHGETLGNTAKTGPVFAQHNGVRGSVGIYSGGLYPDQTDSGWNGQ
jgi:hypothetical protein